MKNAHFCIYSSIWTTNMTVFLHHFFLGGFYKLSFWKNAIKRGRAELVRTMPSGSILDDVKCWRISLADGCAAWGSNAGIVTEWQSARCKEIPTFTKEFISSSPLLFDYLNGEFLEVPLYFLSVFFLPKALDIGAVRAINIIINYKNNILFALFQINSEFLTFTSSTLEYPIF